MGKTVHFDTKKRDETPFYADAVMECGARISVYDPGFKKRLTTVKSHVTCKNCLKKIGIEQKPVVDEQKKEMAQAIWANAIQIATHSYCVFCQSGTHSDNGIVHDKKCIVTKVAQYLESLEA